MSVQLPPAGSLCHMDQDDIAEFVKPFLDIARNTAGLSDVLMRSPWDVSYRFFATIEGEEWPDTTTAGCVPADVDLGTRGDYADQP